MSVLEESAVAGSRLDRLLEGAVTSRLHLALVLVGKLKMDAGTVLDLRWSQVDLDQRVITSRDGLVGFGEPIAGLFYWHAVRQRMDHLQSRRWADAGMVGPSPRILDTGLDYDASFSVATCWFS